MSKRKDGLQTRTTRLLVRMTAFALYAQIVNRNKLVLLAKERVSEKKGRPPRKTRGTMFLTLSQAMHLVRGIAVSTRKPHSIMIRNGHTSLSISLNYKDASIVFNGNCYWYVRGFLTLRQRHHLHENLLVELEKMQREPA